MAVCSCGKIDQFLNEGKVQISYIARFREYSINTTSGARQLINHCPWCGEKLPASLGDRWVDELAKLGFDDPFVQRHSDPDFPEKYKTDAWWRERNIDTV